MSLESMPDACSLSGLKLEPIPDASSLSGMRLESIPDACSLSGMRSEPIPHAWALSGMRSTPVPHACALSGMRSKPIPHALGCQECVPDAYRYVSGMRSRRAPRGNREVSGTPSQEVSFHIQLLLQNHKFFTDLFTSALLLVQI